MNRRVALIAVGASVALLLAWLVLFWGPLGGRISDAEERERVAEEQNQQLELRIARLRELQSRSGELLADLDALKVAIPDQPNLAQFLLDTDEAAARSGVQFVSISPQPPAAADVPGVPSVIQLSMNVEGGYFQVLDFLNRLTDLPRLLVIDNISVTTGGTAETSGRLTVAIVGRMFTTAAPTSGTPPPAAPGADTGATTTTTAPAGGETTTTTVGGGG